MNKKEKQQIKYLLENLKWYAEAPNEQDYNGEYEPPMEWEQGETKVFLKYLEEQNKEIEKLNKEKVDLFNKAVELNLEIRENKDKENERLHSIIKEVRECINKKLNINSDYVDYDFGTELLRQELLEILDKENI